MKNLKKPRGGMFDTDMERIKKIEKKIKLKLENIPEPVVDGIFTYALNDDKKTYTLIRCDLNESQTELTIPSMCQGKPVTAIGSIALCQGRENHLVRIVISEGIERIEDGAFALCTLLQDIYIPQSVEEIRGFAFRYCLSLKNLFIPKNVIKIDDDAFEDCQNLKTILCESAEELPGWSRSWLYSFGKNIILGASRPKETQIEPNSIKWQTIEDFLISQEERAKVEKYSLSIESFLRWLIRKRGLWLTGDEVGKQWYLKGVSYAVDASYAFDGNYDSCYMVDEPSRSGVLAELTYLARAVECNRRAAEHGVDLAMVNYAMDLFHRGQPDVAFEWIQKASDRGLAVADLILSLYYKNGYGSVEKSEEKGTYYRKQFEERCANSLRDRVLAQDISLDDEHMISHWQMVAWMEGWSENTMFDTFRTSNGNHFNFWWRIW